MSPNATIVDADIATLSQALQSGCLTSVDLVAKYLLRIAKYDCRDTALNSIPLINQNVFNEAAAADDRRSLGRSQGPLDGLPFTVKDSYKVKGMTVASGSEAFENLIANEDAYTVLALRGAGAILLGKTNMCPMAYGGMIRGLYGRSESPYNKSYLPAAFGSGSSHGSGVSVASSFAAFGMGEETVSSGRSPASNNALVAYTPSRGLISIRGNWPLYPTCDVVVPHTRTVGDLLNLLDVITGNDENTVGDFWRDQPFIEILPPSWKLPTKFTSVVEKGNLAGKRIAVPKMYITNTEGGPFVAEDVKSIWYQAKADLEAAGAVVEEGVEFPVMKIYEEALSKSGDRSVSQPEIPEDWNSVERGILIAYAWQDFLQNNQDSHTSTLVGVQPSQIFPQMTREDPQLKFTEPTNMVQWSKLAEYIQKQAPSSRPGKSCMYDVPQLENAVLALESMRKQYFENWMDENKYDFIGFPAAGDVAAADADVDFDSAEHAWTNGVKYSHGNRAFRHLGIPSVTIPMGNLQSKNMPMGLTLLGRAYDDVSVIQAAHEYERRTHRRKLPPLTPPLESDTIPTPLTRSTPRPSLSVTVHAKSTAEADSVSVIIDGNLVLPQQDTTERHDSAPVIDIFIDGHRIAESAIATQQTGVEPNGSITLKFACKSVTSRPPIQDSHNQVSGKVARDSIMVMILARNGQAGWPAGFLKLIHNSEI